MPRRAVRAEHSIDWLGAGLLSAGTAALLLGLVWGGRDYAWSSGHVLGAFSSRSSCSPCSRSSSGARSEPILPFELLRNPIVAGSVACMALVGMAMFGTVVYAPLFVQGVIGTTATSSGVVLTPLLLGAVGDVDHHRPADLAHRALPLERRRSARSCSRSGWRCSGRWTCTRRATRRRATWRSPGIGIGAMMQVFVISIQNAVARARIGSATALGTFSRQIGATIGVTVMGVIVNHGLPPAAAGRRGRADPPPARGAARARSPPRSRPAFFAATLVALAVWVIAVLFVKEVPLRRTVDDVAPTAAHHARGRAHRGSDNPARGQLPVPRSRGAAGPGARGGRAPPVAAAGRAVGAGADAHGRPLRALARRPRRGSRGCSRPSLPLDTLRRRRVARPRPVPAREPAPARAAAVPRLTFEQLDIRTYVTLDDRPGVWLCSVDVSNPVLLEAAKRAHRLPGLPRADVAEAGRRRAHGRGVARRARRSRRATARRASRSPPSPARSSTS